ncbi:MAG: M3 family oligoendopeptidase [Xenococcaceae cyanobacterium]
MTSTVDFSEILAESPVLEKVTEKYQTIATSLTSAQTQQDREIALRQWEDLRRQLNTWSQLTYLHFHQDTQNEEYKKARDYCDELTPKLTALEINLKRQLLNSPQRSHLEELIGKHAFALWQADITTFDPSIETELVRESKLVAEYTELLASAKLEFKGEILNLSGIKKYTQDRDRQVRHEALKVRWQFFSDNKEKLDRNFHELVQLRHQMAKKLGYENYIGLGYQNMRRIDYGQAEVAAYCDRVAEEVVPIANQLIQRKTQKLNLDKIFVWDEAVLDLQGNPTPKGEHDWMLVKAQEMFEAMHPELGDFFAMMRDRHLLDLKTRAGKAGGGFCTSFPNYEVPFIFANFNGTQADVEVFTHEMGHAFQSWQSRNLPVFDYLWPTMESAEIHSMSLEFLTWGEMERFFEKDAQRFRQHHLANSLMFLPYGVAVDRFQHLVYAHPDATPDERHQMWQQVEARFLPWSNYGDLTHPAQGGLWQEKQHIYCSPFYYIDYTLALCCALQFWVKSERDFQGALTDYIALCQRGGAAPFQELVRSANLVSPFVPGALTQVCDRARQVLGL